MIPQKETEAKQMMDDNGSVTITVHKHGTADSEAFDEVYTNIVELLNAIRTHENNSTVYF